MPGGHFFYEPGSLHTHRHTHSLYRGSGSFSSRTAWPPAPRSAAAAARTAARGQKCSQVSGCGRKPSKVFIGALALLFECVEYLVESSQLILHAPSLWKTQAAQLVASEGYAKIERAGVLEGAWALSLASHGASTMFTPRLILRGIDPPPYTEETTMCGRRAPNPPGFSPDAGMVPAPGSASLRAGVPTLGLRRSSFCAAWSMYFSALSNA